MSVLTERDLHKSVLTERDLYRSVLTERDLHRSVLTDRTGPSQVGVNRQKGTFTG